MRRLLSVPMAAVLCLVGASAALAAPPSHEMTTTPPLEFAAGEMCDFAILLDATTERSKSTTFAEGPDGSTRLLTRGIATNTVTNLDTGDSLTFSSGYRIAVVFHADGSIVADGTGGLFAYYFDGDPSDLGPGLHVVDGHAHEEYAPDGSLVAATFSGHSQNMCEALAG